MTVTIRKDYLRRLIASVRRQIKNDPDTIAACSIYGQDTIIHKWLSASLLCDVVEEDIEE
jgi:hypothetical protein